MDFKAALAEFVGAFMLLFIGAGTVALAQQSGSGCTCWARCRVKRPRARPTTYTLWRWTPRRFAKIQIHSIANYAQIREGDTTT